MHSTATRLASPPRFAVAGVARASVSERDAKDSERGAGSERWAHASGYSNREAMERARVGRTMEGNFFSFGGGLVF